VLGRGGERLIGTREKMYAQGGIFSITSRILVVDLLSSMDYDARHGTTG